MIKRFLAWLKSIYLKPAAADIKTPEVKSMSDIPVDVSGQSVTAQAGIHVSVSQPEQLNHTPVTSTIPDANQQAVSQYIPGQYIVGKDGEISQPSAPKLSPLEALKARDDEFVNFVVHGLTVLGEGAEAELVALKAKYF